MRMRMFAAALAVMAVAGLSMAMEHDIRDLQARLAAQEARMADQDVRMNDLQAKIASDMSRGGDSDVTADNVMSLRKNAKVTIGGLVTSKYTYTDAKVDSERNDGTYGRAMKERAGDFKVGDAELSFQVDVNDYFDAFINLDLHNDANDYRLAEVYYMRWKNICNSGFGIKVGRDALVFGEDGVGELGSYAAGSGDGAGEIDWGYNELGGGNLLGGGLVPLHNGWDVSGVTQVTPYWEGLDGKLSFEFSFMQSIYEDRPYMSAFQDNDDDLPGGYFVRDDSNGRRKIRSRNYGLGTMSARARYSPTEDLNFTASIANYRSNGNNNDGIMDYSADHMYSKNNTVYGLAVNYRPSFFNRLYLWAQWVYGHDVYFYKDLESHALNAGASFDLTESLTFFAQGDYLRSKYDYAGANEKGTAWAFYSGLQYSLPYGVSMEIGWKHERIKLKDHGTKVGKTRANTIYGILGFEF